MRQVILDTETTGMEHSDGHRVIEIGCVVVADRRVTNETYRQRLNPERSISPGATRVHGIRREDLADEPRFSEIAENFLDFVRGAEVVIHNAPFDEGFLDAELERAGLPPLHEACEKVVDSLEKARSMHPGLPNNLNALCDRYGVDRAGREYHGALLDARLLAEVYLDMTSGQASLLQGPQETRYGRRAEHGNRLLENPPANLRVLQPSPAQKEAAKQYRAKMEAKILEKKAEKKQAKEAKQANQARQAKEAALPSSLFHSAGSAPGP